MENPTGTASATNGVGYKNPPKATQWRKGQSGNSAGKPPTVSIKQLVQQANAKAVVIKSSNGKLKKISQGELVLEKIFHQAIAGNVSAQKLLMEYAKKYLPEPDSAPAGRWAYFDVTAEEIAYLKAFGCLPEECSNIPEEIGVTKLNKARRAGNKIWNKLSSTPEGAKELALVLDKIYGLVSDHMEDA